MAPDPPAIAIAHTDPKGDSFKLYLDSVEKSSSRSRSAIYSLLIALLTVYTAYRFTVSPDRQDRRLGTMQYALTCLEDDPYLRPVDPKTKIPDTFDFAKAAPPCQLALSIRFASSSSFRRAFRGERARNL